MRINKRGMGLTQVIVAIGITSVLISAMVGMTTFQAREHRALTEKLASLDLQRLMTTTLSDPAVCTAIVLNGATQTFDASLINTPTPPAPISLGTTLRATTSATGPTIAEVGKLVSPISTSLKVASIELAEIKCDPPCTPTGSSSFNAVIRANYETGTVRGIASASSPVVLQTTGAGAAKTIVGCAGMGGGAAALSGYQMISQWFAVCNAFVPLCCPGSKKLLGGACTSDWGWCSATAMSGNCFYAAAWTGYAGGSMCGGGILMTITCAD